MTVPTFVSVYLCVSVGVFKLCKGCFEDLSFPHLIHGQQTTAKTLKSSCRDQSTVIVMYQPLLLARKNYNRIKPSLVICWRDSSAALNKTTEFHCAPKFCSVLVLWLEYSLFQLLQRQLVRIRKNLIT